MKTSKRILTTIIALPLLVGSFSALAFEQKTKFHPPHAIKSLLKGVELTDSQKEQIKALRRENRQEYRENWLENSISQVEQRQEAQKLILADYYDENDARALASKISAMQIERHIRYMQNQHELLNVLTPEQKVAVKKNMDNHIERMQARIAKYNQ